MGGRSTKTPKPPRFMGGMGMRSPGRPRMKSQRGRKTASQRFLATGATVLRSETQLHTSLKPAHRKTSRTALKWGWSTIPLTFSTATARGWRYLSWAMTSGKSCPSSCSKPCLGEEGLQGGQGGLMLTINSDCQGRVLTQFILRTSPTKMELWKSSGATTGPGRRNCDIVSSWHKGTMWLRWYILARSGSISTACVEAQREPMTSMTDEACFQPAKAPLKSSARIHGDPQDERSAGCGRAQTTESCRSTWKTA